MHAPQLFVIGVVCFVVLVINLMLRSPWKWVGVGLSTIALLTIIAVSILRHVHQPS